MACDGFIAHASGPISHSGARNCDEGQRTRNSCAGSHFHFLAPHI